MCVCEQQLMLCGSSPLPQKYEENTRICLGNGRLCSPRAQSPPFFVSDKNGVSSVKWSHYEKLTIFSFFFFFPIFPRRSLGEDDTSENRARASSNLSLFMWRASRRGESGAGAAKSWLIFQRQSGRAASRKIERAHLWAGFTRHRADPSPVREAGPRQSPRHGSERHRLVVFRRDSLSDGDFDSGGAGHIYICSLILIWCPLYLFINCDDETRCHPETMNTLSVWRAHNNNNNVVISG